MNLFSFGEGFLALVKERCRQASTHNRLRRATLGRLKATNATIDVDSIPDNLPSNATAHEHAGKVILNDEPSQEDVLEDSLVSGDVAGVTKGTKRKLQIALSSKSPDDEMKVKDVKTLEHQGKRAQLVDTTKRRVVIFVRQKALDQFETEGPEIFVDSGIQNKSFAVDKESKPQIKYTEQKIAAERISKLGVRNPPGFGRKTKNFRPKGKGKRKGAQRSSGKGDRYFSSQESTRKQRDEELERDLGAYFDKKDDDQDKLEDQRHGLDEKITQESFENFALCLFLVHHHAELSHLDREILTSKIQSRM